MAGLSKSETVNSISEKGKHHNKGKDKKARQKTKPHGDACYRCGNTGHYGRDLCCPANGKVCKKCGLKDHFMKMCKTKFSETKHKDIQVEMEMLVDSGATSSIISEDTWEELKAQNTKCISSAAPPNTRNLLAYASDKPLLVKGTFKCEIKAGQRVTQAEFLVIKGKGIPLLGRETAIKLGTLKIGIDIASISEREIKAQLPEVFNGVGKLKSRQVTLHIDPRVKPVAKPPRRTPFNLRDNVTAKIKELLDKDIIEPVEGPTPWVNPIVIVPKQGVDIRLCINRRRANEAIELTCYSIPKVDELLQNMNGSKIFSKLDLKWGYHQLELAPESRGITTFASHESLYRYKWLRFGVNSASEIYQQEI